MDDKIKLLIAIGASITANCQPCLKTAISGAKEAGLEKKEILEAIQIGRLVRRGSTGKMDQLASNLTGKDVSDPEEKCPFGSTEKDFKEWVSQNDECACNQ
jgi:AhpD family alkylhydroperoxidase